MEYFVIANSNNTKFIGVDKNSGGYPYISTDFIHCLIGTYNYVKDYYNSLHNLHINKNEYSIKKINLIDLV